MDLIKTNNFFYNIVQETSKLSTCYRVKVWAIIVQNWRIISSWYNWTPSKILECQEYKKILSSVYNWITKWSLNTQEDIIDYIKQQVLVVDKKYEDNKELLKFIAEETQKYFNKSYLKELKEQIKIAEDWSSTLKKRIKDDFIYRNNLFHSSNSILWEVHAEQNALLFASKAWISVNWCDLYCNYLPCATCAKLIKQAWIENVYYISEYSKDWQKSTDFFKINWIWLKKLRLIEE